MCIHHWMIDSQNVGVCKLCHKTKDFQPDVSTFFGSSKLRPAHIGLIKDLMPSLDYPVQGIVRFPYNHHSIDYTFSVDEIE